MTTEIIKQHRVRQDRKMSERTFVVLVNFKKKRKKEEEEEG